MKKRKIVAKSTKVKYLMTIFYILIIAKEQEKSSISLKILYNKNLTKISK
ncbi:MAG: hypothetical protein ACLS59_07040 [Clostridia bacterium]